ncbi:hypothetical protein YC2023_065847 [Brassica napus]
MDSKLQRKKKGEYKTVTSTTEIASTKETLASLDVLCFFSENASQPQPSSISKPPHLSSSWCLMVIESGFSGSQLDSILCIVSQLKLPRCDSRDDGGAHRGLHRKTEEEAHRGLHRKTEEEASRRRIGIRGLCVNQEEEKWWSCCSGGGEQETP